MFSPDQFKLKYCPYCNTNKPEEMYISGRKRCLACRTENNRYKNAKTAKYIPTETKECVTCKKDKLILYYSVYKTNKCIACDEDDFWFKFIKLKEDNRYCRYCDNIKLNNEMASKKGFQCKKCKLLGSHSKLVKLETFKEEKKVIIPKGHKKCRDCNEIKLADKFIRKQSNQCKDCRNKKRRKHQNDLFDKDGNEIAIGYKRCRECGEVKLENQFRKNRRKCHDCEKEYGRNYNNNNKHIRDKWTSENNEIVAELHHNNYEKNKEQIRQIERNRYNNEKDYKIRVNNKSSLNKLLNNVVNNNSSKAKFLGTPIKLIKDWIEFQFDDEMTWDNKGTYWHIDHVIPINKFDILNPTEHNLCFDWKNIMPVTCEYNMNKKDKLDQEQFDKQLKNLFEFHDKDTTEYKLYLNNYNKKWNELKTGL